MNIQIDQYGTYKKTDVATFNALVSTLLVPKNIARGAFVLWNNSSNSIYISLMSPADSSKCIAIVAGFTHWSMSQLGPFVYTGALYGIRNAGTGGVTVWEFSI